MINKAASLPDEMITEVLQWLPVKSVLRFRAVCRSWDALLSSDEFRSLHMAARRAPQKLLYISPTARFLSTAVYARPFTPSSSGGSTGDWGHLLFTIDGARGNCVEVVTPVPCRGLTLLYDGLSTAYYICNAATRAATRLPPSTDIASRSTTGLGFDALTKEHKVVRLINGMCHDKVGVRCEVYTPGGRHGDRWRHVAGGVPSSLRELVSSAVTNASLNKLPPVFANGCLHWLMDPTTPRETFTCVRSPPFWARAAPRPTSRPWSSREHLVEMDGQMCMVRDLRNRAPHACSLEIWKLLDYGSGGWSLHHQIDFSGQVIGSFGDCRSSRKKIIIATSKHKIDNKYEKKVHTYDPRSEALETILSVMETHSSPRYERPSSRFSLFEETLSPVHKTDEEIAFTPLREILLRLPAKSAIHSKLVCKQWLRLIENENFIESYFKHKNIDRRPKVMLVGKGTGQLGFSFAPLNGCLPGTPSHSRLLDTKVVCSKPCHGLNLVSTETKEYICNPCTGFFWCYSNLGPTLGLHWRMLQAEEHAFTVGDKNVGLTFDPLIREHVIVEIFYHQKDFKSRQYHLTCALRWCGSRDPARQNWVPPLPVSDMPPAYLDGVLEPRLGQSWEWAVVSFDITTKMFQVVPCPSWFARWHSRNHCRAFLVELAGVLCAVLADPAADTLDVWKLEHGQWSRACIIHLKACPGYSLETNVVVPLAIDPDDGRIMLNTGRKIGLYDPVEQTIETLHSLDQVPVVSNRPGMLSTSSENSLICSKEQTGEEMDTADTSIIPFVPMLYEESLAFYPRVNKVKFLW
ncbi:hypothetical protein VPH35_003600 [Triticum aestivum]